MPKNTKAKVIPIGNRKSVSVFLEEDGSGYIQFMRPIVKEDLMDGKIITCAKSVRHKHQLATAIALSKEALCALRALLNKMLTEETNK